MLNDGCCESAALRFSSFQCSQRLKVTPLPPRPGHRPNRNPPCLHARGRQYEPGKRQTTCPLLPSLRTDFVNCDTIIEFPRIQSSSLRFFGPRDVSRSPLGRRFPGSSTRRPEGPGSRRKAGVAFYVANAKIHVDGKVITLPRIGKVKMREALRFEGKIAGATVSRTADRWFIAINVEVDMPIVLCEDQARTVDVDLGVKRLTTLSDGSLVEGPKPLRGNLKRLVRAVSDMGLGAFRRQIDYKAELSLTKVMVADRWFPSSKLCVRCGRLHAGLTLKCRTFKCDGCGHAGDRDQHAARNLKRHLGLQGNPYACAHPSARLSVN